LLVIQRIAERIQTVPREGKPADLRVAIMKLLDQFSFREQITRPIRGSAEDRELPQMILNFNSLEALRRAHPHNQGTTSFGWYGALPVGISSATLVTTGGAVLPSEIRLLVPPLGGFRVGNLEPHHDKGS